MKIYNNNYIEDATLTASSIKSGYSVDNLKIAQLARKFSFTGNTGNVVIEFNTAKNIKGLLVDIGNMSSSASIIVEGNDTNVWTSPSWSESMIYTESAFYLDLDQEYKYFRLVIEDPEVSPVNFGYIYIGDEYLQMPGVSPSAELYYNTTSTKSSSIGGQVYGDDGYEYLETTFNFPLISENIQYNGDRALATRKDIIEMWNRVKNITPVWVMLWAENLDEFPPLFSVINQQQLNFKKKNNKEYSMSLALQEVL